MKNTYKTEDKILQICKELREKAITPVEEEKSRILLEAKELADKMVEEARGQRDAILQKTTREVEEKLKRMDSALAAAYKDTIENLKSAIKEKLIHPAWQDLCKAELRDKGVIAALITSLVNGVEKDGIDSDISVYIPQMLVKSDVDKLLADEIKKRLQNKGVLLSGQVGSGVYMRLEKDKIAYDFTALEEMVWPHLYEEFRSQFMGIST